MQVHYYKIITGGKTCAFHRTLEGTHRGLCIIDFIISYQMSHTPIGRNTVTSLMGFFFPDIKITFKEIRHTW